MFSRLREDIACILERDPAARSRWEVLTCYPGLHALMWHRPAHWLWRRGWHVLARFMSHLGRFLTGIEIHPGATIGRRVFIDHGMGVVIGEMAEVHDECTIYQGVTLGGTSLQKGMKRHPTLERGVIVGANASILGGFNVGAGARVGSGAVVTRPVPAGATIGRRVFIDHGMGVVIGEMAEIADDCTIYQGVTLGGTSLVKGAKRHPTLEAGVIIGANASVLGGFTVGTGARVGSGAVVTRAVPPGATAVGNPARIIAAETDAAREATAARLGFSAYGVTQGDDPVAQAMKGLIDNASAHEHQIALLWNAIERVLAEGLAQARDCVPTDAQVDEKFDAEGLSRLVK